MVEKGMTEAAPPPDQLLRWYLDAGVDECVGETPVNRYAAPAPAPQPQRQPAERAPAPAAPRPSVSTAHIAAAARTLAELKDALLAYDGCPLKATAQNTVFGDGNPEAAVMVVGEAPGGDEDRMGVPFAGPGGKLLDRMLASIGLDRTNTYFTYLLPWRLPPNRQPTTAEVEMCLPFIERHIELIDPQILILVGGPAASTLLADRTPIHRLRGRWLDYATPGLPRPVAAVATYHPDNLMHTPAQKREAWRDLLMVRKRLISAS